MQVYAFDRQHTGLIFSVQMEVGKREEICHKLLLSFIICLMYSSMSDASCSLPQDLRNKVWEYSYTSVSDSSKKLTSLDIRTTTLQNSAINLVFQGTILNDWTCINSLDISTTTTVVVFKSDHTFSKGPSGDNYRLFLCMKLTRITADLYYFYLLSDINTDIDPDERAFESADNDPMSSTVCQYTDSPPKIRTLRKQGTNDLLPNDASLCEPWDSACDVDDMCDPNPCQNNGTCLDLTDSFNCTCAPGWKDDNCTTVMTCDYPNIVLHTTITSSGNELDDTITFSCAVGYEHISGDSLRTCRSDGYWEGSPINCEPVKCPNLPVVTFATQSKTGSTYLDKITYTCDKGYERTGGNLVRTCKEDKQWDGSPPVCSIVRCANPPVVAFTISSQTGSNYNDIITYTCNIGYENTDGTLDRKCKETKLWDGVPPVCTKVTCPNPPDVSFATISAQPGSNYNDTITYTCNDGYEHTDGTLDRKCKETKLWDGIPPVCSEKNTITTILKQNGGLVTTGGLLGFGIILVPIAFCCIRKGRFKDKYMDTSTHDVKNSKKDEDYHVYDKPAETYQIYRGRQYGYENTSIHQ